MKSGRIPSQTTTTMCSARPFGAGAPTAHGSSGVKAISNARGSFCIPALNETSRIAGNRKGAPFGKSPVLCNRSKRLLMTGNVTCPLRMKWKAARLSVVLLCSGTALEAQTSWIDGVGDWFNFFNWSNGVPNSGSATSFDAQINNGGIAQIFSPGASVRRITLGNLSGQGGGLLVDLGSLNVTENLRLGENGGMGNMTIRNDADVSASQTILGVFSGSGLMTVSGNGSTLTSSTLILAELASGTMVVRDGADVSGSLVSLANASTSALGRLTVTGAGSVSYTHLRAHETPEH